MYDNLSATSIPSDIHLISSSSPMIQQHFYDQMFTDLCDVVPVAHYHNLHQRKLRNTRSIPATSCGNQDHLIQLAKHHHVQQASIAQQQQYRFNQATNQTTRAFCPQQQQQHYLTIEELKMTRNSCWLCGCNWQEDHVSLDCPECDGYALSRPCPSCDGKCKQMWQRNISATHDKHRAFWTGQCALKQKAAPDERDNGDRQSERTGANCAASAAAAAATQQQQADQQQQGNNNKLTKSTTTSGTVHPSSSSVCSSHPSSAASSDDEPDDFLAI